ncbi:hypothetical protein FOA52_009031 [Chlamydomonas sp. UWO 241]|nr:hypothetical protein FOA52_009031 [Chlamydomonas sp. UWO 241]
MPTGPSPRSIYGTFTGSPSRDNAACHNAGSDSNCQQMYFSNGTVYPNNNDCRQLGYRPEPVPVPGLWPRPAVHHGTATGVIAPTNYPITYDAKSTCNLAIMAQNLYNTANPSMIYAKLFAFKDYSDNLYTVSINASGFMAVSVSDGQLLLPNSALASNPFPTGLVFVGSTFPNGHSILQYAQYTTSQTLSSSVGQYSCFAMMIPLSQACPSATSTFVRGVGGGGSYCASRTTGAAVATVDLSSTVNLFFSAQFNVSKYTTTATSCGAAPTNFVNIGMGNTILDLYGAIPNTQSLSRNCAAFTTRPHTSSKTYQLLGLYNSGAYSYTCQTQTVTTSTGAIQWSGLWMKGNIWAKLGAIAYPVGLSGAPGVPPPCGFFGMAHSLASGMVTFYSCSANNVYNNNATNPLYFVPPQGASPAAFDLPNGINLDPSARRVFTAATNPFGLASTGLPPPLNNAAAQFTNLFNQLYSAGVAAEYPTSPLFNFVGTLETPSNKTDYPLIAGTITGPPQWPVFLANFAEPSRMNIFAGQFGLTCSDLVWANISGCPGLADANVAFTGYPSPPGIPTGTGFPNATMVYYNKGIPACTSAATSCTADGAGLMAAISISVSTQGIASPSGMVCTNVAGGLVVQISFTLQTDSVAFYNSVMKSTQLNGCAVVTPLPKPTGFVRVAYKFYFNLFSADWSKVSAALNSLGAIREAHVMCDSTVYFQTYTSPAINTRTPIDATTNPTWLSQAASKTVCYSDVKAPLH